MKNYLAKSLYHWLAITTNSESSPKILSCSDTTVQLAAHAAASVKVGHVLIHTDPVGDVPNAADCDPCATLFREITADLGEGRFLTEAATFAQVFPPETYDPTMAHQAVEAVLPGCDTLPFADLTFDAARVLQDNTTAALDRKKDNDKYEDDHYDDDDKYVDKKKGWEAFCDATKEFFYDMYCIIRNLDCAPYDADITKDDDHYDDDDDKHRELAAPARPIATNRRGLKGAKPVRKLQEEESVNDLGEVPEEDTSETGNTVSINFETEGISTGTSDAASVTAVDHKDDSSKDKPDDDHYYDDDDFFDDDDDHVEDEANFWKIIDAVFGYIEKIVCIFKDCPELEHYEDDDHYEDNDKHRALTQTFFDPSALIEETTAWLGQVLYSKPESISGIPTSTSEWMTLHDNGNCAYTKCHGVEEATQCFVTPEQSVAQSCRASLANWFALPSITGQDTTATIQSWDLDVACSGQDFCYASNVFEQTTCDEQFYKSLLQSCPQTALPEMILSRASPLATSELYEHCSLVSILLFSQAQQKSDIVYSMTQENQQDFEAQKCH